MLKLNQQAEFIRKRKNVSNTLAQKTAHNLDEAFLGGFFQYL